MATKETPGGVTTLDVRTPAGERDGTVDLPQAVFGVQVNVPLIHQVVVAQMAATRQGTHKVKTRSEVRGGGKKPYKQKGTGRARQGSTRAPQFVGGGVVHGPVPRSYAQRTPKKMKAAALRGALSDRAAHGRVHVLTGVVEGETPSTKAARTTLAALLPDRFRSVLVVLEDADEAAWYSLRNLPEVHVLTPGQLNTRDVLLADDVVFTSAALAAFLELPAADTSRRTRKVSAFDRWDGERVVGALEVTPDEGAVPAKSGKATAKAAAAETTEEAPATAKAAPKASTGKAAADKADADKAGADSADSADSAAADNATSTEEPS